MRVILLYFLVFDTSLEAIFGCCFFWHFPIIFTSVVLISALLWLSTILVNVLRKSAMALVHGRKYACAARLSDRTPLLQTHSNYVDWFCRQSSRLFFSSCSLAETSTGSRGFMVFVLLLFFLSREQPKAQPAVVLV